MYISQIKFFDLFGDLLDTYDAYALDAFRRDGTEILTRGGAVHFDYYGRAFFYRGHFRELRPQAIAAFQSHVDRMIAARS
ncbi:MAG TPA: hypothetical protein VGR63_15405 [Casimicrobiaceae bacterium]|jgi:hypothetical protein|nr:hypothetical protein [Casimicrobiaceae bacterium]